MQGDESNRAVVPAQRQLRYRSDAQQLPDRMDISLCLDYFGWPQHSECCCWRRAHDLDLQYLSGPLGNCSRWQIALIVSQDVLTSGDLAQSSLIESNLLPPAS